MSKLIMIPNNKSHIWWLIIVIYVACLPWAILVFNALIASLSLAVARWIPVFVLTGSASLCFLHLRRIGNGYYVKELLLPVAIIVTLVALLEPNPIKHIHIPEYALLVFMLYLAQKHSRPNLIELLVCAVLLGISDELHQGAHHGRYYGWKDMLINTSGAMIACIGLRKFYDVPIGLLKDCWRPVNVASVLSISVLVYSLSELFSVQSHRQFAGIYPQTLILANMCVAVLGGIAGVKLRYPILLASSFNHALIVIFALSEIEFR